MKKKRNLNNLVKFRKLIFNNQHKENQEIHELIKWRKNLLKKTRFKTKLVNFNNCKDWYLDKNNSNDYDVSIEYSNEIGFLLFIYSYMLIFIPYFS